MTNDPGDIQRTPQSDEPTEPVGDENQIGDEELPPVEPPSPRFIAQLFLIPALIVGGIVGLVLFFGWVGSGTRDWQTLVTNLGRDNPHRRGRAAHDLAQLLNSDHQTVQNTPLRQHPPLANALARLARQRLDNQPAAEQQADHHQQLVLMLGLLGLLDAPETTFPVLGLAIAAGHDPVVRKTGLEAIAAAGKRAVDRDTAIDDPATVDRLISVVSENDASLRRDATAALGIFRSAAARAQLESLLDDPDAITRYNAAAALVHQGSQQGLPVFRNFLQSAADDRSLLDLERPQTSDESRAFEERWLLVRLSLKAIGNMAEILSTQQRADIARVITPLVADDRATRIRIDAKRVLQQLGH